MRTRFAALIAASCFTWMASALLGCGSQVACENCGSGGGGGSACASTLGKIEGTTYLFGAPGEPSSQLAPGVDVQIYTTPDVPPLIGKADDQGHFSIELEAGTYLIVGNDNAGCESSQPIEVTLDACETETFDLVLDICTG